MLDCLYNNKCIDNAPESYMDEIEALRKLAQRVAQLNAAAGEIGPGMLASLVDDARAALSLTECEMRSSSDLVTYP